MAVTRAFEADDFHPAYGILILADTNQAWDPDEDPPVPHHRDRGDTPTGAFAGSGAGWIAAQAPGLFGHTMRVELHDEPPRPITPTSMTCWKCRFDQARVT